VPHQHPPRPHVDYRAAAADYARTRTLAGAALAAWRTALEPHLGRARTILDLGAGTGQFALALAGWFDAAVVAVEPRAEMAAQAQPDPGVWWVAGRGEAVPLADGSVDGAWLSAVVHHFDSLDMVAGEVARVVRPGGVVAVRGFFRDTPLAWHFAQFPGIERSVAQFPPTADVVAALGAAGLALVHQEDVAEVHDLAAEWADKIGRQRTADTMLRPLTDDEFSAGVAAVGAAVAQGRQSVDVALRLLVCRRSAS